MAIQKETKKIIKKAGNTIGLTYLLLLILFAGTAVVLDLPNIVITIIHILTPYISAELLLLIEKNHVVENVTTHNQPMVLKEIKNRLVILGILYVLATANKIVTLIILCSYIISSKIILNRIEDTAKKKINKSK